MRRDLERLADTTFDLLVIGGGIHGLAAAYDAAQRGLATALVDQGDLGSGSSFNHLKTVHGGLRSLQSADFARFRESIRERHTMARIAPHLVQPLGFLLATTRKLTRSRAAFAAAFALDALLGADRNRDLPPHLHLPAGRVLSLDEYRAIDPAGGAGAAAGAAAEATGGALWFDYQMPRAERLTLAFAHAAAAAGATLANYVAAERLLIDSARHVVGAQVRDLPGRATCDVRARVVLNAAGAGIGPLLTGAGLRIDWPLQKAINLVVARPMPPAPASSSIAGTPVAIASSHAGGTLIRVPWSGRTIAGTWHSESAAAAQSMAVTEAELSAVLRDVNAAFPQLGLTMADVTLVHRGLVPAVAGGGVVKQQSQAAVLDHGADGVRGLLSIRGVKYTTGRLIAERAIDQVEQRLGRQPSPSRTARTALPGSVDAPIGSLARDIRAAALPALGAGAAGTLSEDTADHLARSYGSTWIDVLALTRDMPSLAARLVPSHPAIAAEVIYAIRQEMALTLTDVIVRRIQLGSGGHPGDDAARRVAAVMQQECGWSDERVQSELAALREFYRPV